MSLTDRELDRWLYGTGPAQRHTQDSPILPDVWYAYALPPGKVPGDIPPEPPLVAAPAAPDAADAAEGEAADARPRPSDTAELLLRPWKGCTPGQLAAVLRERLERQGLTPTQTKLAFNDAYAACTL